MFNKKIFFSRTFLAVCLFLTNNKMFSSNQLFSMNATTNNPVLNLNELQGHSLLNDQFSNSLQTFSESQQKNDTPNQGNSNNNIQGFENIVLEQENQEKYWGLQGIRASGSFSLFVNNNKNNNSNDNNYDDNNHYNLLESTKNQNNSINQEIIDNMPGFISDNQKNGNNEPFSRRNSNNTFLKNVANFSQRSQEEDQNNQKAPAADYTDGQIVPNNFNNNELRTSDDNFQIAATILKNQENNSLGNCPTTMPASQYGESSGSSVVVNSRTASPYITETQKAAIVAAKNQQEQEQQEPKQEPKTFFCCC